MNLLLVNRLTHSLPAKVLMVEGEGSGEGVHNVKKQLIASAVTAISGFVIQFIIETVFVSNLIRQHASCEND